MAQQQIWDDVRHAAAGCTRCDLYRNATQTVFGEGPLPAPLMLVGEQPGDQEDLKGHPFVGPAGQMLDRALAEAGIDRSLVYVTNAVKHFKFVARGKRRLHQKPDTGEIEACKFWILKELETVRPRIVVALGATAAQSLVGRSVTIGKERGRFRPYPPESELTITVHPSYLLRLPDQRAKAAEYQRFVGDLEAVRRHLEEHGPAGGGGSAERGQLDLL